MRQAAFVVDLARCTGCYACLVACKDRSGLSDGLDWLRVEATEGGAYPRPTLTYRVAHCFHCADAACMASCPVDAIVRDRLGLVQVDGSLCIGCEACVDACPFGAMLMLPEGVASKCDGCAREVERGWDPTCVRACPTRALSYSGDGRANVPKCRSADEVFDDHGIGPRVIYLK